jgi:hypothetical protein
MKLEDAENTFAARAISAVGTRVAVATRQVTLVAEAALLGAMAYAWNALQGAQ